MGRRVAGSFCTLMILIGATGHLSTGAGAKPMPFQGLVVVGHQYLVGENVTIDQPILIPPGATLTIGGSRVHFDWLRPCTNSNPGGCAPSVTVQGTLNVFGSTLDSTLPDGSRTYSVYIAGGAVRVEESTILRIDELKAEGPGTEPSALLGNVFRDGFRAPAFLRGAEARIENNLFENFRQGLVAYDGTSTIRGNTLRHIWDVGIDVEVTQVGEKLFPALTAVENNTVEDAFVGILNLNSFENRVTGNVVRRAHVGVSIGLALGDRMLHNESPVFEGNRIEASDVALSLYTSGEATLPESVAIELRGNSFVGSVCNDLKISEVGENVELTVDARGNWWGSAAGPQEHGPGCPAIVGNATFAPWLAAEP